VKRKFSVTQEDIERGEASNCAWCPVAWALRRFDERAKDYCAVTRYNIRMGWHFDDDAVAARPTKSVRSFIHRFDSGLPVTPFNFALELKPLCAPTR
jgi:hypothetical protein